MLTLPESLTVKRNSADERLLLDASRKWLEREERTKGLHASDFLDPLQSYWKHVDPRPNADRVIPIFLIGKVLHSFVLGALDGKVDLNVTDEGSSFEEELQFWYSPDWDKGEVAEFKTSRSFKEPKDINEINTYLEQVLIYMVAKKRTKAKLWVLYLNLKDEQRRTSPEFRAYTLTITDGDLGVVREELRATKGLLENAISTGDPSGLPLCRDFKCGRGRCDWYDSCKPAGRYGTRRFDGPDSAEVVSDPPALPRAKKSKAKANARRSVRDASGVPVLGTLTSESRDGTPEVAVDGAGEGVAL